MLVSLQLTDDAARAQRMQAPRDTHPLTRIASDLGIVLRPVHPGASDALLQTFFTAEVPDGRSGNSLVERLRAAPGVLGATVKPPDELP